MKKSTRGPRHPGKTRDKQPSAPRPTAPRPTAPRPTQLRYDFANSIGCWIGTTRLELHKALNQELSESGITPRQVQVLAYLALHQERSQVALAEDLQIEASTLTRVLDRMQRDGWIERRVAPGDRRMRLVRPTARVGPTWRRIVRHAQRIEQRATAGLSRNELDTLRTLLERVRCNLQQT